MKKSSEYNSINTQSVKSSQNLSINKTKSETVEEKEIPVVLKNKDDINSNQNSVCDSKDFSESNNDPESVSKNKNLLEDNPDSKNDCKITSDSEPKNILESKNDFEFIKESSENKSQCTELEMLAKSTNINEKTESTVFNRINSESNASEPKEEFKNIQIKKLSEIIDNYKCAFGNVLENYNENSSEENFSNFQLKCKNHPNQKKLFLCLNVDCPLKVYCNMCKNKTHSKRCSRIGMELSLNDLKQKEDLMDFFDVEKYIYEDIESSVKEKFLNLRKNTNNLISEMEKVIIKKMKAESKEFKLKQIFQKYQQLLQVMNTSNGNFFP